MNTVAIEPISKDNLTNLASLFLELWEDCDFDEELENCNQILCSENETCFLIKEKAKYIAFIHLTIRSDYVEGSSHSPTAYIEGLFVKEDFRHRGFSKQLVKHAEEWSKEKKCTQLASDTELTNLSSIDFHKKVGFKEVNRIVCFIKEL